MNIEKYNYEEKKQRHVEIKKDAEARVGPGAYINPKVHSEFRPEPKPEYLQFFGSTEERFKTFFGAVANSSATLMNPSSQADPLLTKPGDPTTLPGPGTYDPNKDVKSGHN
jgi:Sperm-tail PG-rich repeat